MINALGRSFALLLLLCSFNAFAQFDPPIATTQITPLFGPQSQVVSDEAFAPARAWQPGMPREDRTRIVVIGAIFTLVAIGCALIRRRRMALLSLGGVTLVTSAGIFLWQRSRPALQMIRDDVIIVRVDPSDESKLRVTQVDRWQFFATRSTVAVPVQVPAGENTVRVSCDEFPINADNFTEATEWTAAGQSMFLKLRKGDRAATLTRSATPQGQPTLVLDRKSLVAEVPLPLKQLANGEYGTLAILGTLHRDQWSAVVVEAQ